MFKSIVTFKENKKKMEEEVNKLKEIHGVDLLEKMKNGEASLVLDLTEENIYQPFSSKTVLNNDIFDYLDPYFYLFRKLKKINIECVFPESFPKEEKEEVIKKIKNHYVLDYEGNDKKIRNSRWMAFFSLIIGILLLALNITLSIFTDNQIANEVIDIFAWVFVWEACDLYTFSSLNYSVNKAKAFKFFNANYIEKGAESHGN